MPRIRKACRRPSFPSGSRALPAKRRSPRPASDRRAASPGRSFLRRRRSKSSGRIASRWRKWRRRMPILDTPIFCASPINTATLTGRSNSLSSAKISPNISAPKARRCRSTPRARPARAPSSSAWKRSAAANATWRSRSAPTLRSRRNCWCASRSFRRCRRRTIRPSAPQNRSRKTAMASCWRKAPPLWCSKA